MFAFLVAFVLLIAGVGVIYLLLKKMSEDGVDIAAPGSCRRGQCQSSGCRPAPSAQNTQLLADEPESPVNQRN